MYLDLVLVLQLRPLRVKQASVQWLEDGTATNHGVWQDGLWLLDAGHLPTCPTWDMSRWAMDNYVLTAHPELRMQGQGHGGGVSSRQERLPRPTLDTGITEADWTFFEFLVGALQEVHQATGSRRHWPALGMRLWRALKTGSWRQGQQGHQSGRPHHHVQALQCPRTEQAGQHRGLEDSEIQERVLALAATEEALTLKQISKFIYAQKTGRESRKLTYIMYLDLVLVNLN